MKYCTIHSSILLIVMIFLFPSTAANASFSPQGIKLEAPKWQGTLDKKKRRVGQWIYGSKSISLIIANYKAGELHGSYQSFYANGKKRQQAAYITNLLSGQFTIYYNNKNNTPAVRGKYHKGHKFRLWSRWTFDHRLISQANYDKGLLNGHYVSYVNSKIYQKLHYRHGLLDGLAIKYNPANKKIVEQGSHLKNVRHGIWRFWSSDGSKLNKTAQYTKGRLHGIVIQYNENGRLWKSISYKNGILDGLYKEYFDIKNKIISTSGNYTNGKRQGIWTYYYSASRVWKRSAYIKGNLHGNHIFYYPSGRVLKTMTYLANKLHGKFEIFSDRKHKSKLLTGQYRNNFRTGKWLYWYPDGKTANKIVYYKKGSINGVSTRYYPSGRQWVKSQYKKNELNGVYIEYYDNARNSKKLRGAHKNNIPNGKWTYWNSQGKVVASHKQKHAKIAFP
ncbi:hypothetical protein MNBD_GAMMA12-25 [hydrothermal vent metagenome]|uniref:Uncharacterized protein n=1 Tax=hydrothermal vent metagenome TaxID=652676 RepID=A0A3B0XVZ7_9ZZZZ